MTLDRTNDKIQSGGPIRIVTYGDSISEIGRTPGYFGGASSVENNWGARLCRMLEDAYSVEFTFLPFGIGGQNSYEALGRIDSLRPLEPDLVLVALGANDCGWHPLLPDQTKLALSAIVGVVRDVYMADVIVVGTGGDNPTDPMMQHVAETVGAARDVATERGVPFVDIRAAMIDATGHGERWAEFHNGAQDCHPSDAGMVVWAQTVFDVIEKYNAAGRKSLSKGSTR